MLTEISPAPYIISGESETSTSKGTLFPAYTLNTFSAEWFFTFLGDWRKRHLSSDNLIVEGFDYHFKGLSTDHFQIYGGSVQFGNQVYTLLSTTTLCLDSPLTEDGWYLFYLTLNPTTSSLECEKILFTHENVWSAGDLFHPWNSSPAIISPSNSIPLGYAVRSDNQIVYEYFRRSGSIEVLENDNNALVFPGDESFGISINDINYPFGTPRSQSSPPSYPEGESENPFGLNLSLHLNGATSFSTNKTFFGINTDIKNSRFQISGIGSLSNSTTGISFLFKGLNPEGSSSYAGGSIEISDVESSKQYQLAYSGAKEKGDVPQKGFWIKDSINDEISIFFSNKEDQIVFGIDDSQYKIHFLDQVTFNSTLTEGASSIHIETSDEHKRIHFFQDLEVNAPGEYGFTLGMLTTGGQTTYNQHQPFALLRHATEGSVANATAGESVLVINQSTGNIGISTAISSKPTQVSGNSLWINKNQNLESVRWNSFQGNRDIELVNSNNTLGIVNNLSLIHTDKFFFLDYDFLITNRYCLHLDGTDFITLPSTPPLVFGGSFTVELWFYYEASALTNQIIFDFGPATAFTDDINVQIDQNTGILTFALNDSGGPSINSINVNSLSAIPPNQWTHLAVTYDDLDKEGRIYINGNLDNSDIKPGFVFSTAVSRDSSFIGQSCTGFNRCPIYLMEFKVWDTLRTEKQIQKNLMKVPLGDEPSLLAYWAFNDGIGTNLVNSSVTGPTYDASLSGGSDEWFYLDRQQENFPVFLNSPSLSASSENGNLAINAIPFTTQSDDIKLQVIHKSSEGLVISSQSPELGLKLNSIYGNSNDTNSYLSFNSSNLAVLDGPVLVSNFRADGVFPASTLSSFLIGDQKTGKSFLKLNRSSGEITNLTDNEISDFQISAAKIKFQSPSSDFGIDPSAELSFNISEFSTSGTQATSIDFRENYYLNLFFTGSISPSTSKLWNIENNSFNFGAINTTGIGIPFFINKNGQVGIGEQLHKSLRHDRISNTLHSFNSVINFSGDAEDGIVFLLNKTVTSGENSILLNTNFGHSSISRLFNSKYSLLTIQSGDIGIEGSKSTINLSENKNSIGFNSTYFRSALEISSPSKSSYLLISPSSSSPNVGILLKNRIQEQESLYSVSFQQAPFKQIFGTDIFNRRFSLDFGFRKGKSSYLQLKFDELEKALDGEEKEDFSSGNKKKRSKISNPYWFKKETDAGSFFFGDLGQFETSDTIFHFENSNDLNGFHTDTPKTSTHIAGKEFFVSSNTYGGILLTPQKRKFLHVTPLPQAGGAVSFESNINNRFHLSFAPLGNSNKTRDFSISPSGNFNLSSRRGADFLNNFNITQEAKLGLNTNDPKFNSHFIYDRAHIVSKNGNSEGIVFTPTIHDCHGLECAYYQIQPPDSGTYTDFESIPEHKKEFIKRSFTRDFYAPPVLDSAFITIFSGYLKLERTGNYTFYTNSKDGSLFFINQFLVVNNDTITAAGALPQEVSGSMYLNQGYQKIELIYFNYNPVWFLDVQYEGPGISKQQITSESLFYKKPLDDNPYASRYFASGEINFLGKEQTRNIIFLNHIPTSDHITLPGFQFPQNSFTIETWAYLEKKTNWGCVFDFGNGEANSNLRLTQNAFENTISFHLHTVSGVYRLDSTIPFPVGEWFHVAAVLDEENDRVSVYLNGREIIYQFISVLGLNLTEVQTITRATNYIGRSNWAGTDFWIGAFSEFRIWSNARSKFELETQMHYSLEGTETSLLNYWKFNEASGINTLADSVTGNPDANLVGNGDEWITWKSGDRKFPNLHSLQTKHQIGHLANSIQVRPVLHLTNADSDFASFGQISFPESNFTLETWVKLDSFGSFRRIIECANLAANQRIVTFTIDNQNVHVGIRDELDNLIHTHIDSTNLPLNTWVHISFTFSTSNAVSKVYLNGVFSSQINIVGTFPSVALDSCFIGSALVPNVAHFFDGSLCDLRIWNSARSSSQIKDNYCYQLSGNEESLVTYWKLDEGKGFELNNSAVYTGNNLNATITGSGDEWQLWKETDNIFPSLLSLPDFFNLNHYPEQIRSVLELDSANSEEITFGLIDLPDSSFTFETWVSLNSYDDYVRLLELSNGDTDLIAVFKIHQNELQFDFYQDAVTFQSHNFVVNFPLNQWIHVAASFNSYSRTTNLFVNGRLASSKTHTTGNLFNLPIDSNRIGGSFSNDFYLDGKIAESRLWNTARSVDEIIANYTVSLDGRDKNLVAYWKMDEGTGTTLKNYSESTSTSLDATLIGDGNEWLEVVHEEEFFPAFQEQFGGFKIGFNSSGRIKNNLSIPEESFYISNLNFSNRGQNFFVIPKPDFNNNHRFGLGVLSPKEDFHIVNFQSSSRFSPSEISESGIDFQARQHLQDNYGKLSFKSGKGSQFSFFRFLNENNPSSDKLTIDIIDNKPFRYWSNSLQFKGEWYDHHATIPDPQITTGSVTIEAWVWIDQFSDWDRIIEIGAGHFDKDLVFHFNDSKRIRFGIFDGNGGGTNTAILATTMLEKKRWYHILASFDEETKTYKIFVDGKLENQSVEVTAQIQNIARTENYIGKAIFGSERHLIGKIKELRIWNYARTEEEVLNSFRTKLNGYEEGLLAYYPLNEGIGATIFDHSPNNFHGTVQGAEWIRDFEEKFYSQNVINVNDDNFFGVHTHTPQTLVHIQRSEESSFSFYSEKHKNFSVFTNPLKGIQFFDLQQNYIEINNLVDDSTERNDLVFNNVDFPFFELTEAFEHRQGLQRIYFTNGSFEFAAEEDSVFPNLYIEQPYKDDLSYIFHGNIYAPVKGNYQFFLVANQNAKLTIDNQSIIADIGTGELTLEIPLEVGFYNFQLEYRINFISQWNLKLQWQIPGRTKDFIRDEFFFQPTPKRFDINGTIGATTVEKINRSVAKQDFHAVTHFYLAVDKDHLAITNHKKKFGFISNYSTEDYYYNLSLSGSLSSFFDQNDPFHNFSPQLFINHFINNQYKTAGAVIGISDDFRLGYFENNILDDRNPLKWNSSEFSISLGRESYEIDSSYRKRNLVEFYPDLRFSRSSGEITVMSDLMANDGHFDLTSHARKLGLNLDAWNNNSFNGSPAQSKVILGLFAEGLKQNLIDSKYGSYRFSGWIYLPEDADYTFRVFGNSSFAVEIDGNTVTSNGINEDLSLPSYSKGFYQITAEFVPNIPSWDFYLRWSLNGSPIFDDVPNSMFYHHVHSSDIKAETILVTNETSSAQTKLGLPGLRYRVYEQESVEDINAIYSYSPIQAGSTPFPNISISKSEKDYIILFEGYFFVRDPDTELKFNVKVTSLSLTTNSYCKFYFNENSLHSNELTDSPQIDANSVGSYSFTTSSLREGYYPILIIAYKDKEVDSIEFEFDAKDTILNYDILKNLDIKGAYFFQTIPIEDQQVVNMTALTQVYEQQTIGSVLLHGDLSIPSFGEFNKYLTTEFKGDFFKVSYHNIYHNYHFKGDTLFNNSEDGENGRLYLDQMFLHQLPSGDPVPAGHTDQGVKISLSQSSMYFDNYIADISFSPVDTPLVNYFKFGLYPHPSMNDFSFSFRHQRLGISSVFDFKNTYDFAANVNQADVEINEQVDVFVGKNLETATEGDHHAYNNFIGSIATAGQTVTFSDQKLKLNITEIPVTSNIFNNVAGVSYSFKHKKRTLLGFIAQNVEKEFPEIIVKNQRENLTLSMDSFFPLIISSLKHVSSRVECLEHEIFEYE